MREPKAMQKSAASHSIKQVLSFGFSMKLSRKRARSKILRIPASTPCNPLVAATLQRKAGVHRKSRKAERRAARAALKKENPG